MDKVNLAAWVGREEVAQGGVGVQLAAMLHATLGEGDAAPVKGEELPPLWHWCAFLPAAPMAGLKVDGHPKLGSFLPPVPLERRMWAGGSLEFLATLRVGESLTRRSVIEKVVEKDGATGPMVFVTVGHEVFGGSGLAIRERQDIVYLPLPDRWTPPGRRPTPAAEILADMAVTETLLFRYSACTFNAHRIHYDLAYAREVEHYPGLVVHGPLQATCLIAVATAERGLPPDGFSFRGVHPLFREDGMRIMGRDDGTAMDLWTVAGAGHPAMEARATWKDVA